MDLRRQYGFSLIELLIVVAIIGIIAAIAIPSLIRDRMSANGASAVEATRLFHSTEVTYQAGTGEYGTAESLFKHDLIDGVLAAAAGVNPGTVSDSGLQVVPAGVAGKDGYQFGVDVTVDGRGFTASAVPVAINRTGDLSVSIDQTGELVIKCTPPKQWNPVTHRCEPVDGEATDGIAINSLLALDRLAGGGALSAIMQSPPPPQMVQQVMSLMDVNHDGQMSADEIFNADILGMTRAFKGGMPSWPDQSLPGGSRAAADLINAFRANVARELAIGIGGETPRTVPVPAEGNAMRLIELASEYRSTGGAIRGGQ